MKGRTPPAVIGTPLLAQSKPSLSVTAEPRSLHLRYSQALVTNDEYQVADARAERWGCGGRFEAEDEARMEWLDGEIRAGRGDR